MVHIVFNNSNGSLDNKKNCTAVGPERYPLEDLSAMAKSAL